jgi:hypothetical protein
MRTTLLWVVSTIIATAAISNPAATVISNTPNPIYDAAKYLKPVKHIQNGTQYTVQAPGAAPLDVYHVFGSPTERGYAHGLLMSARILDFIEVQMPRFYRQQIAGLDLDNLPKWLADAIRKLLPAAEKEASTIFGLALGWLETLQRPHNSASRSHLYDEIDGIAKGVCAAAAATPTAASDHLCREHELRDQLRRLNMLPDLIKMQCSMLGAHGSATPTSGLVQLRSLDFGGGPFANNTVLIVHHPDGAASERGMGGRAPFAALTFPGFVGVVTGFSPSVALSEKVNDIHGGGTPPGSYDGKSTAFVIREMVEWGTSKEAATAIAAEASRTWGVWLGVGDAVSQSFVALEYMRASTLPYNSTTLPTLTGQPPLTQVAYIDKHPQPSNDPAMHAVIAPLAQASALSASALAQQVPRATQSGDVHSTCRTPSNLPACKCVPPCLHACEPR